MAPSYAADSPLKNILKRIKISKPVRKKYNIKEDDFVCGNYCAVLSRRKDFSI